MNLLCKVGIHRWGPAMCNHRLCLRCEKIVPIGDSRKLRLIRKSCLIGIHKGLYKDYTGNDYCVLCGRSWDRNGKETSEEDLYPWWKDFDFWVSLLWGILTVGLMIFIWRL